MRSIARPAPCHAAGASSLAETCGRAPTAILDPRPCPCPYVPPPLSPPSHPCRVDIPCCVVRGLPAQSPPGRIRRAPIRRRARLAILAGSLVLRAARSGWGYVIWTRLAAPQTTRSTPPSRLTQSPRGMVFSISTNSEIAPIQVTLINPPTNGRADDADADPAPGARKKG